MKLVYRRGKVTIWESSEGEFYVYGVLQSGDPRVCPSRAMAMEVAAGH